MFRPGIGAGVCRIAPAHRDRSPNGSYGTPGVPVAAGLRRRPAAALCVPVGDPLRDAAATGAPKGVRSDASGPAAGCSVSSNAIAPGRPVPTAEALASPRESSSPRLPGRGDRWSSNAQLVRRVGRPCSWYVGKRCSGRSRPTAHAGPASGAQESNFAFFDHND